MAGVTRKEQLAAGVALTPLTREEQMMAGVEMAPLTQKERVLYKLMNPVNSNLEAPPAMEGQGPVVNQ